VLAIEVEFNGKRLTVAGAKDLSVLTAYVSAVGLLGPETVEFRPTGGGATDLHLRVGGLTSRGSMPDQHLNWIDKLKVQPGDTVIFRVVEVEQTDPPIESSPATRKTASANERAYFKEVKKQYLRLRKKYEQRGLTARSRVTRRKRRAPKRGR
jgi:hypothetical protein